MPHEHPTHDADLAAVESCLREAYGDLEQQPLPPGLHNKIKGALMALRETTAAEAEPSTAAEASGSPREDAPGSESASTAFVPTPPGEERSQHTTPLEEPLPSSEAGGFSTSFSMGAEASRGARWLTWVPLVALACVLLLPYAKQPHQMAPGLHPPRRAPLFRAPQRPPARPMPGDIAKAGFAIEMYHARKTTQGFVSRHKTQQGTRLAPGDLVQFVYKRAKRPTYVAILSVNHRGSISPYYPLDQGHSVPLTDQGKLPASGSLVLDQYIGPERIFALVAEKPFSLKLAKTRLASAFAKSGGDLTAMALNDDAFRVISFLIIKHRPGLKKP